MDNRYLHSRRQFGLKCAQLVNGTTAAAHMMSQALKEIDPLEAVLVKESDGSDWELGVGSLGKARCPDDWG